MKIWIAVISHKYGNNVYAARSEKNLYRQLWCYARSWWAREIPGEKFPETTPEIEAVRSYFNGAEDEFLEVCDINI